MIMLPAVSHFIVVYTVCLGAASLLAAGDLSQGIFAAGDAERLQFEVHCIMC